MKKRGQGATEYLIILAVIIVIALIVVGVLGGIPGIGSNSQTQAAKAYWSTSEVGIATYSLSAASDTLTLKVKNNQDDSIKINSVTVDSTENATVTTISPGQESEYKISKTCDNQGDAFDYEVTISYLNVPQAANYSFTGVVNLVGDCAQ